MNDLPEFEGFWWSPDEPKTQLPGRLIADDNAAKLILTINNPENLLFSESEPREYEVLHGCASNGKLITLLKCFDLNASWLNNRIEKRVILVNYVLIGGLVPQEKIENAFSKLSLKWPGLQRWFFDSGISVERDENNFRSFTIKYKAKNSFQFKYTEDLKIEFSFSTDKVPFGGSLNERIEFKEIVWVTLKKEIPESLDYYLYKLDELIHFFSVCVLEYSQPEEIIFVGDFDVKTRGDGMQIPPPLKLYCSSVRKPQEDRLPHPSETLIPYGAIKDNFQDILRAWANISDDISPSRSLYFSSLYGANKYIDSIFLSLAQAAEVFHRRIYGGTYISDAEYQEKVLPALSSAIPTDLDSSVKQVFKQRLEFFNEYSLSKRLKMMASNHKDLFDVYVPDWKSKISGIVKARNYYTHYSEEGGNVSPDASKVMEYKDFLKMLLELEMMSVANVDKSLLHNQAKQCQRYRRKFSLN